MPFKKSVNDSCDVCDAFTIKLKEAIHNEQFQQEITADYDKHLDEATLRYREKAKDKPTLLKPHA